MRSTHFFIAGFLLFVACSPAATTSSPARVPPVAELPLLAVGSVVTPVAPLGSLRASRLAILQDNLAPALKDWELSSLGTACTLVYDTKHEWLVGCDASSSIDGFVTTSEAALGRPVLFNPQSFSFGAGPVQPYAQVFMGLVGTVATQKRGADKDDSPVLVLQDWDALHENHPGFTSSGIEEWLGIGIHEAFHAHQLWHPRVRALTGKWGPEGRVSPDELAAFVRANADYRGAVDKEVELLKAAVKGAPNPSAAKAALRTWQALRKERETSFSSKLEAAYPKKHAWEMDGFYTFVEGTARYVEARFLMSPSPETIAALSHETTFLKFAETVGKKPTDLPGLSNGGPKYVYAVGMYLSFLLDAADPSWKRHVFDSDGLLLDAVARATR